MTWSRLLRHLATVVVAGSFLGVIGPYGSMEYGGLERFGFWLSTMAIGWFQTLIAIYALMVMLPPRKYPGALIFSLAAVLATFPLTLQVAMAAEAIGWMGPAEAPYFHLYPRVLAISLMAATVMWVLVEGRPLWFGTPENPVVVERPSAPSPEAAFLARVADSLGGKLLCLETEDHYLRVRTTEGEVLVLKRLRDAVEELDGADGLQVHRSWWVARRAVRDVRKEDRRTLLVLVNGLEVPVSRSNLAAVREAGWI